MTDINLIPWRHLKREREKREVVLVSVFIILTLASFFLVKHNRIKAIIKNKKEENHWLKDELTKVDEKINALSLMNEKKGCLISNIEKINRSKNEMSIALYFLGEIANLLPDDIYLELIQIKKRKVIITGYSGRNNSIYKFIKSIDKNPCMKKAVLISVSKNEESSLIYKNEFNLSLLLDGKTKDCWRNENKNI